MTFDNTVDYLSYLQNYIFSWFLDFLKNLLYEFNITVVDCSDCSISVENTTFRYELNYF